MKEYLFGMKEDDFDTDIHAVTGLIDVFEHPIIKMTIETKMYPVGFGREKEWDEFERTSQSCSDTRESFRKGKTGSIRQFKIGNFSLPQI